MTIFSGDSLLVSLPGAEIQRMTLTGSVVSPEEVFASPISAALRSALGLLCEHAGRHGRPVQCIARPELFTNDLALAWLRERITAKAQHVCLSDGTTVKYLPGVPTHVFFYCRSSPDNLCALRDLFRRAPELLSKVRSQINSCFAIGHGPNRLRPKSLFLLRTTPRRDEASPLLRFFLNLDSVEDSVNRIEQAGPVDVESLTGFTDVRYLVLSEAALCDRAFSRTVAALIQSTFFHPKTLLIIRSPPALDRPSPLFHGIGSIVRAVGECGMTLPRVFPNNILLTDEDIEEEHKLLKNSSRKILVHESFEFWRHTAEFYANSQSVAIISPSGLTPKAHFLPKDITGIYGLCATRQSIVDVDLSNNPPIGAPVL